MASRREVITSRGTSRFIRRDEKGRFTTDEERGDTPAGQRQDARAAGRTSQGSRSSGKDS